MAQVKIAVATFSLPTHVDKFFYASKVAFATFAWQFLTFSFSLTDRTLLLHQISRDRIILI